VRRDRFNNNNRNAAAADDEPLPPPMPYERGTLTNDTLWEHDMYADEDDVDMEEEPIRRPGRVQRDNGGVDGGAKLRIEDLDFNVSEADIKDLFGSVGVLKFAKLKYDRSGRSEGVAEVLYTKRSDALSALKQYNGVSLDGKPMKITLVSSRSGGNANGNTNGNTGRRAAASFNNDDMEDFVISTSGSQRSFGGNNNRRNTIKTTSNKPWQSRPRGSTVRRSFRGRGLRSGAGGQMSSDALDAELDAYTAAGNR
jgi:THO complex subunit 4